MTTAQLAKSLTNMTDNDHVKNIHDLQKNLFKLLFLDQYKIIN